MKDEELLKIFLKRADIKGPDDCWPWLGPIDATLGYGRTSFLGYPTTAHRTAWILANGEQPPKFVGGRKVLLRHLCSNRRCVNPKHIALGNYSDNGKDASELGRGVALDITEVKECLRLRKEGKTYYEIGKALSTLPANVANALNGKRHCYRIMLDVLCPSSFNR